MLVDKLCWTVKCMIKQCSCRFLQELLFEKAKVLRSLLGGCVDGCSPWNESSHFCCSSHLSQSPDCHHHSQQTHWLHTPWLWHWLPQPSSQVQTKTHKCWRDGIHWGERNVCVSEWVCVCVRVCVCVSECVHVLWGVRVCVCARMYMCMHVHVHRYKCCFLQKNKQQQQKHSWTFLCF